MILLFTDDRFLDAPEIHRPVDVKVIDKAVDRIVEVFQKKPMIKVLELGERFIFYALFCSPTG